MRTTVMTLGLLLAGSALADDHCLIEAKKNDRAAKGSNVVIASGEKVEDAMVVEGDVIVKSGAQVKDAIALNGSVIVEAGAHITGNAISIGGKLKVDPKATVDGSQISLKDSLKIVGDSGTDFEISLKVGGKDLARELLKPMLVKFHECGVIAIK
jgi:NDP-sugar pyrophosphorylase family protein